MHPNKVGLSLFDIRKMLNEKQIADKTFSKTDAQESKVVEAGVLLLLYYKGNDVCILLNKRSQLVEHHKGEIAFPGGVKDPEDKNIQDTALREVEEEMGVKKRDVEVIGKLSKVKTRTNFIITPFVGTIPSSYPFKVSDYEVSEILEIPMCNLLTQLKQNLHLMEIPREEIRQYKYEFGNHTIWGATANILSELLFIISTSRN